jgi:hypothetical protein
MVRASSLAWSAAACHIGPMSEEKKPPADKTAPASKGADAPTEPAKGPKEIGGPKGPEPTRYGDWERNGRCIDF